MKAAYILDSQVHVGEVPDPVPGSGQALVRTHRCGLCASDAHFLHAGQNVVDLSRKHGGPYAGLDLARPFVPGHEYVGEIVDYGPGSKRIVKPGRRVTSIPIMRQSDTRGRERRRGLRRHWPRRDRGSQAHGHCTDHRGRL